MGKGGGGTQAQSTLTRGQRDFLDRLTALAGSALGSGVEPYGGTLVAPMSPLQQIALGQAYGLNTSPLISGQSSALRMAMNPYANPANLAHLGQLTAAADPMRGMGMYMHGVQQPIMRQLTEQVLPAVNSQYGSYQTGGGADTARGEAIGSTMANLAGLRSQFLGAGLDREAALLGQRGEYMSNMMGQALGGAQLAGEAAISPIRVATALGQQEHDLASAQLQENYWKWSQAQPYENPYVKSYGGMALGTPAFALVQKPGGGGLAGILGK